MPAEREERRALILDPISSFSRLGTKKSFFESARFFFFLMQVHRKHWADQEQLQVASGNGRNVELLPNFVFRPDLTNFDADYCVRISFFVNMLIFCLRHLGF